jgi:hypothetical protein
MSSRSRRTRATTATRPGRSSTCCRSVSWALAGAKRILPPEPRGVAEIPFGAVVPTAPQAGPYAQLAAWLGRQP